MVHSVISPVFSIRCFPVERWQINLSVLGKSNIFLGMNSHVGATGIVSVMGDGRVAMGDAWHTSYFLANHQLHQPTNHIYDITNRKQPHLRPDQPAPTPFTIFTLSSSATTFFKP
jgi:hypothetical protein